MACAILELRSAGSLPGCFSRIALSRPHSASSRIGAAQGLLRIKRPTTLRVACRALADAEIQEISSDEDQFERPEAEDTKRIEKDGTADFFDWEQEWYPLYLESEMPKSAPLGLTLFDRPLVLFYDDQGQLHCFEDKCPHRLAKLSEGQVIDGRLECLYHGWQFDGTGQCTKIPQLVPGAKIPKQACAKTYVVKISQEVIWVWAGERASADTEKLPWFEHYAKEGFQHFSTIHELPYDYSILLENVMDPAHIPISHDRTDPSAKRENSQPLIFDVMERSSRGFAGKWRMMSSPEFKTTTRFEAPGTVRNDVQVMKPDGTESLMSSVFTVRPTGQGKCMVIARFGSLNFPGAFKFIPKWFIHKTGTTIFEQDMGFLASQNEHLVKENRPTKELYLNLKSSDTWVSEYRKWNDRVGHGMPYYFGHHTLSPATKPALMESAPAGASAAAASSSYPAQGAFGAMFAKDPTNRYFRHVVHCKSCLSALHAFQRFQKIAVALSLLATGVAIVLSTVVWRASLVVVALLALVAAYACSKGIAMLTQNYVRPHRK